LQVCKFVDLWEREEVERFVPLLLGGAALLVYLLTMAPELTWGRSYLGRRVGSDGGDLVTAAWVWGVPHPTGYPTFTTLAGLFARLPLGSVAWRVHLLSGVAGAATVALLYLIGRRLAAERARGPAALGAAVGALLLAFSSLFWAHSLIAEVYTLHLFFVALLLWLVLRWRDGDGPLWPAALAFGLGMGNHVTLTFLGPAIALLLWTGRGRLAWRGVLQSALALALGLTVYVYLPWRAATDPVVNWGAPDTWQGFRWTVGGQGYRRFFFALPRDELLPRLGDWWRLTAIQFTPLAWPLAALGLWELARRDRWPALGTFLHAAINLVYSVGYTASDAFVNLLPVYFYVALWMGQGALWLLGGVWPSRKPRKRARPASQRLPLTMRLAIAGLLLLPLLSLVGKWDEMNLTHDRQAQDYAREALETVEPGSLILVGGDSQTFALWYYYYVKGLRPDVLVANYEMLAFDWYSRTIGIHHPEIARPDPNDATTLAIVALNLNQRPVYIADDGEDLGDLRLIQVGPLWRVTAP
jgi:hypothetical protein